MSGVIYIITTGDEAYVGSTINFKKRMNDHKSNIYNKNNTPYNCKLYKKIRENNCQYEINIYEDNLSLNKKELCIYEEEVRLLLGATLNSIRAYRTKEQTRQLNRENGAVDIKCECGCVVIRSSMSRHKISAKHIKLMISQEKNEMVKLPRTPDSE